MTRTLQGEGGGRGEREKEEGEGKERRGERAEGELESYCGLSHGDVYDSVMAILNCTLYNDLGDKRYLDSPQ